jgi:hypothetical protein
MVSAFSLVIGLRLTRFANLIFYSFFFNFHVSKFIGFLKKVCMDTQPNGGFSLHCFGRAWSSFFEIGFWVCCLIYPFILFVITFYTNFNKNSVRKDSRFCGWPFTTIVIYG